MKSQPGRQTWTEKFYKTPTACHSLFYCDLCLMTELVGVQTYAMYKYFYYVKHICYYYLYDSFMTKYKLKGKLPWTSKLAVLI